MIPLSNNICETLDLVYWKLKDNQSETQEQKTFTVYQIADDQRGLLENILKAINIQLDNSILESIEENKIVVKVNNKTLIFEDVNKPDQNDILYLAGLGQMQQDPTFKKQTWLKLKAAFL